MKNIKLTIAYEGTHYLGWQKTNVGKSIEGCLEEALERLLQSRVKLQAASRTDAGVHATGQIINFFCAREDLDLRRLSHGLNALLPSDIRVLAVEIEKDNFHPTLDCTHKEYHYRLCYAKAQYPHERHTAWHLPFPLDVEAMEKAAQYFVGTHDFHTFCNQIKNLKYKTTVRTIHSIRFFHSSEEHITLSITGNNFLYKMVRNIAGTLAYVGAKKLPLEDIPLLLTSKDRTKAAVTAPAHGLTLHKLYY